MNYTYDAWGAFTMEPASPQVSSTDLLYVSMLNPVTYRGYFYDLELGLYYLQSRYYDPETGRFLSADALMDSGKSILSTNLFAYCDNHSVDYVDKSGNYKIKINISVRNFLYLGFSNTGEWFTTPWTTTTECLQAHLGYCDFYDFAAPAMGCFIDNLISEFSYNSKKWRVEFWKGRYGINRGAEIGFYNQDNKVIIKGFYHCIKKEEGYIDMYFLLHEYEKPSNETNHFYMCNLLFERHTDSGGHWWLTGFLFNGWFSFLNGKPNNLVLDATISFYTAQMAIAFNNHLGERVKQGGFYTNRSGKNVNIVWAPANGTYVLRDKQGNEYNRKEISNANI